MVKVQIPDLITQNSIKIFWRIAEKMIEIERGIEIPSGGSNEFLALMKKMEIGDSFLVRDREITQKVRSSIQAAAKYAGIFIKTKTVGNGLRVWRISVRQIRNK